VKKYVVSALLASVVISSGSAFAAPVGTVELDGTLQYIYRWEKNYNNTKPVPWVNGGNNIEKFILNAKTGLAKNLDAYARFGAENVSRASMGIDFYDGTADGSKKNAASIDQVGLLYQNAGWSYKLGRQDSYIGGISGLYSSIYFVGPRSSVDGVHISGKSGVTDIDFQAFQEHYSYLDDGNRVYALHASYNPTKELMLGATVAKYDDRNKAHSYDTSTNNWAVNSSYTMGKATVFGEYGKSNASTENVTWAAGLTYVPDAKNTFNVIHYDGGMNGDLGGWQVNAAPYQPGGGGFEPDFKGMYYILDHKIDKSTTATLFWRNMKALTPNQDGTIHSNDNLRVIVTYAF